MPVIPRPGTHTHDMNGVHFTALAGPSQGTTENCVWQVEVPAGTPAAPHELTREELLVVLSGRAEVVLGDDRSEAGPGDTIVVPPDTLFALQVLGDEPFRALVAFPVGGQARLDGQTFVPPWAA